MQTLTECQNNDDRGRAKCRAFNMNISSWIHIIGKLNQINCANYAYQINPLIPFHHHWNIAYMASKYACGDMMTNSHLKPTMMIMMITMMTMMTMIMMIMMVMMHNFAVYLFVPQLGVQIQMEQAPTTRTEETSSERTLPTLSKTQLYTDSVQCPLKLWHPILPKFKYYMIYQFDLTRKSFLIHIRPE